MPSIRHRVSNESVLGRVLSRICRDSCIYLFGLPYDEFGQHNVVTWIILVQVF